MRRANLLAVAAVIMACVRPSASFCVALRPLAAASALGGKSQERTTRIVMQQAENSWNFGRFAKTFGFFNGNPLLKLIPFAPSGEPSVKQPDPVVSGNELVLWNFQGMDKVCIRGVCMHACLLARTGERRRARMHSHRATFTSEGIREHVGPARRRSHGRRQREVYVCV